MGKNIVVCCDGTGNEISENISNVLKLYRTLRKTEKTEPRQVAFYDPGVGTLARPDPFTKFKQDFIANLGLALGYGLDDNVLRAYEFLIDQYEEGDDIFLFGFSRGAYTARVLAGLIHKVGVLSRQQKHLAGAALTAYKQAKLVTTKSIHAAAYTEEGDDTVPIARDDRPAQFARIVSSRWPTIRFLGVWDTVASVVVPRPDRFYAFTLQELLNTRANPSVKVFRQAIAIDERRRMFRLHTWDEPQVFMHNRFSKINNAEPQNSKQVWFSGVHADIGGGYPEAESGLSKFALLWMLDEAVGHGLSVDRRTVNQLAWGVQRKGSPFSYVAPDVLGEVHKSLSWQWLSLEYLPKADRYKEWKTRKSHYGWYIPGGEPRPILPGALIHESVFQKMESVPDYRPENIPSRYEVVPMPAEP